MHQNFPTFSSVRSSLVRILVFSSLLGTFAPCKSVAEIEDLAEKRKQYLGARKSLREGHFRTFEKEAAKLVDYPLYPYLQYDYLRRRLWKVKTAEVADFLDRYADLPMANDLRRAWLKLLVKRRKWQSYIDHYTPQKDRELQCNQLLARINTDNKAYLLEDIRSVWLVGESLPPQCDPAFALLYKSDLLTDELVWERIRLSMENGQTSLAAYLTRKLTPGKQVWAKRWIEIHNNPSKSTYKVNFEDNSDAREILLHGMRRLLRQNINRALSRWEEIKPRYSFTKDEIDQLEYDLAMRAARKKHKQAKQLLDEIDTAMIDEQALHLRLRTALADEDWQTLVTWTEGEPADEDIKLRWLYWRARALEQTGDTRTAMKIYEQLAKERDYYGFMAADRINAEYQMNYHPLPEDLEAWQKLSNLPAILRARELFHLGSYYSARREWHHALKQMTSYQKQIAASIAANWGWHDRAILTLARAEIYDDLVTRFPMPFEKTINQFSEMRNLDLGWIYALTRAESAFIEDVRSPAGALGLMQVMPATGKDTAKRIGLRNYNTKKLLQSDVNVRIGTAYLKHMYESFNNNTVLATAAYNAGPTNVKRWLPRNRCEEPDIWIEKIPFTETRKYVRRILYFASIYDWRLKREIIPVSERTSLIQPGKLTVASKSCSVKEV